MADKEGRPEISFSVADRRPNGMVIGVNYRGIVLEKSGTFVLFGSYPKDIEITRLLLTEDFQEQYRQWLEKTNPEVIKFIHPSGYGLVSAKR